MNFKKSILAAGIALSMVATPMMSMMTSIPVMAETIVNATTHDYYAYQIFSGTQNGIDGDAALGDIKWGSGIDPDKYTDLLNALKAAFNTDKEFDACTTALDVAKVMGDSSKGFTDNSDKAKLFAKTVEQFLSSTYTEIAQNESSKNLAPGYYLLVDVTDVSGKDDVKNLSLLQLTKDGDITISKKNDKPSVDKQVGDELNEALDYNAATNRTWDETADHEIGEVFQFRLLGTIPVTDGFKAYETYAVKFSDTMSAGITYKGNIAVNMYVLGENETMADVNPITVSSYKALDSSNSSTPVVETAGLSWTLEIANVKSLLTSTQINSASSIVIEVIYDAALNSNAVTSDGTITVYAPGEGNDNSVRLTYSNNPNYGGSGDTGQTDIDYVFVATYTTTNNKIDGESKEALKGAEFILKKDTKYAVLSGSAGEYKLVRWSDSKEDASTIETDDSGVFAIAGLDEDTVYTLEETKAPAGYNKLTSGVDVTVAVNHEEGTKTLDDKTTVETINLEFTDARDDDTFGVDVENNKGSTLPETGGMGTTILYVAGGILVLGAAIFFVTNRRMQKN